MMRQNNHRSPGLIVPGSMILLAFIIISSGCAGAAAGAGAGATASSRVEVARFAGTWEGGFDAGTVFGDMRLVLNYEDDTYNGILLFDVEGQSISGDILKFATEGNSFSFWTSVEGMDVLYEGTIEGNELTGTLEAYMGNEVMGEGTFFFVKK